MTPESGSENQVGRKVEQACWITDTIGSEDQVLLQSAGFDGAQIKGRKRHIVVDTLGSCCWCVFVHSAIAV